MPDAQVAPLTEAVPPKYYGGTEACRRLSDRHVAGHRTRPPANSQIGDDTLGAAVVFRRHGFGEWGNLRNLHDESPWRYGETHILTRKTDSVPMRMRGDLVERIVAIRL